MSHWFSAAVSHDQSFNLFVSEERTTAPMVNRV